MIVDSDSYSRPIVAIHQPNFAPWAGYFHKMLNSDIFIFLDSVPFTRNSLQNRNRILTHQGVQWLTIPVLTKGNLNIATNQIMINEKESWRKKHLATLQQTYGKLPGWSCCSGIISGAYGAGYRLLVDFAIHLLRDIVKFLKISSELKKSSEMRESGDATERLILLVRDAGGRSYLSGPGGRKYLDENRFAESGIKLLYQEFAPNPYPQGSESFIPNLSILDVICRLGSQASDWLRGTGTQGVR
jgi:hypothetical protein